ncbi:unnamed protein product [Symbiodinium sp. CCMP2592]|nr:unnamed protein product [Symbiodinium sp. CCMP2592]
MVNTGMGLCILPQEADRLNEGAGSLWVGIYLGVCGAAQLVCPLAGKLSDRHASSFGRRRPFIVAGSILSIIGLVFLRQASISGWPLTYLVALLVAQVSLNLAFSAHNGLPADLYCEKGGSPKDTKEKDAAGVVSAFVAMLGIVLFQVCGSFMLDPRGDQDFLWVCVGRLFYYVSTSVTVFLYYYIRDTLQISAEGELRVKLASLVIAAQVVGALVSVPAGRSSNTFGRKPVIYAACTIMSLTFLMYVWLWKASLTFCFSFYGELSFVWILLLGSSLGMRESSMYQVATAVVMSWIHLMPDVAEGDVRWHLILAAGLCYGLGSGVYVSVDYALALDCLPEGKSTAEAFGLWGISGFFGSTAGPVIGGLLLAVNQAGNSADMSSKVSHYTYGGYAIVMLLLGVSMNLFVVAATYAIRGTK